MPTKPTKAFNMLERAVFILNVYLWGWVFIYVRSTGGSIYLKGHKTAHWNSHKTLRNPHGPKVEEYLFLLNSPNGQLIWNYWEVCLVVRVRSSTVSRAKSWTNTKLLLFFSLWPVISVLFRSFSFSFVRLYPFPYILIFPFDFVIQPFLLTIPFLHLINLAALMVLSVFHEYSGWVLGWSAGQACTITLDPVLIILRHGGLLVAKIFWLHLVWHESYKTRFHKHLTPKHVFNKAFVNVWGIS